MLERATIDNYRAHLLEETGNKHTADRYYYAVRRFLREYRVSTPEEVTPELILEALAETRTKNDCSALRNGLRHLSTCIPSMSTPATKQLNEISAAKRNRSSRPAKTLYLEQIQRTVNGIRNEKLRYGFRLMMVSGIRVSELAALAPEDIACTPEGITVNVRHGKGGSNGKVSCLRDPYLEKGLPAYLAGLSPGEAPFYSAAYMKKQAWQRGLECHDFRRIAAIQFRQGELERRREEPTSLEEVDQHTKDFLRHERFSTTKRYLYNRKLKIKMPMPEKSEEGGEFQS